MIIVEGPDGAGKSTLVATLREEFDLLEGTRGTSDRKKLYTVTVPDTMRALCQAVAGNEPPEIWDRLFYSERIYHDLAPGRPNEFSEPLTQHIEQLIAALDCPVILCLPMWETVAENAKKDEQMDGVLDNLHLIYDRYLSLWGELPNNALLYDYTGRQPGTASLERVIEVVNDYITTRQARSW